MRNSLQYRSIKLLNALFLFGYINSNADTTTKVQTMAHIFKDSILLYDPTLENKVF